jgi:hypothetical protein
MKRFLRTTDTFEGRTSLTTPGIPRQDIMNQFPTEFDKYEIEGASLKLLREAVDEWTAGTWSRHGHVRVRRNRAFRERK